MYKKRFELRVMICGKRTKHTEIKRKQSRTTIRSESDGNEESVDESNEPPAKKARWTEEQKNNRQLNLNELNAAKRIKLKSVQTRTKALIDKGQIKTGAKKGQKGKRLGGVVKRAMKASSKKNKPKEE